MQVIFARVFIWCTMQYPGYHCTSGPALCGATLRPPEVKSYKIICCIVQREHIVENCCDLLGFKCCRGLLSMQFIHSKSFWTFYYAFYKDNCTFSTQIQPWKKMYKMIEENGRFLLRTPVYGLCHICEFCQWIPENIFYLKIWHMVWYVISIGFLRHNTRRAWTVIFLSNVSYSVLLAF